MNYKEVYRQTINDKQFVMPFGKFKGKTIEFILDCEPWYISWLNEKTDLDFDHKILDEAENGPETGHLPEWDNGDFYKR